MTAVSLSMYLGGVTGAARDSVRFILALMNGAENKLVSIVFNVEMSTFLGSHIEVRPLRRC
ncbi:hypothetical protein [Streptomyces mirabilis]|uniref:hypothetical protein n=1 Tax=Streptomyces mirabilis TaxID=68239 RepID=UPI0033BA34AB